MSLIKPVSSFLCGNWVAPGDGARPISSAITDKVIYQIGGHDLDTGSVLAYGREVGNPALRAMNIHDRARMVKALALHLQKHRAELYQLSYDTGATAKDHLIDVDGGIGTALVMASKARRELPDGHMILDGAPEILSRNGSFIGQHMRVPLHGVAVLINAFNFPIWGMLEKLAPCWIAGMPAIVKPASSTAYVAEAAVRIMLQSGILPKGALQLISGSTNDLFDHLTCQDVVSFTGSAATAGMLGAHQNIAKNAIRFGAEQDSLNASILGEDVLPGSAEFDLFIKEVSREMTVKAGQKCTAIRRVLVPKTTRDAVISALSAALSKVTVGDPRDKATSMGALVSNAQVADVTATCSQIATEAELAFAGEAVPKTGAFFAPRLYHCADPDAANVIHEVEAFGPVATILPYRDTSHAITLANRGGGSLVTSVITASPDIARNVVDGAAPFHGRIYFNNAKSMGEATGHGAPLPHMVHGGPGRAGGGEELGGMRALHHYTQRTAVQGDPDLITALSGRWMPGAARAKVQTHPFRKTFHELEIGETLTTPSRKVTLEDIESFAHFTGDTFYAHMDEKAASANPFFPGRVAHGYLLLSFAAGLFVDPTPGPVLANTGLDNLSFQKPVVADTEIHVLLTVKGKTRRTDDYGEVRWAVMIKDAEDDVVATYDLLTMVAYDT